MKIILDTNIWYDYDDNNVFQNEALKNKIAVTYLNYFELIKKRTIVSQPDFFRKILFGMDNYDKIFEPPFVYIAQGQKYYNYNVLLELEDQINFILNFKKGGYIDSEKEQAFYEYISKINNDFQDFVDGFNREAMIIKPRIKNLVKHRIIDSLEETGRFLKFLVVSATGQEIDNFDISKVELLTQTLNTFFKKMEVGELIMKANDVTDFLILSYVQPGDKYYTKDKKWRNLIIESGMQHYLL